MSKIRNRFIAILVSFLTLPSIAVGQSELRPASENSCEVGWQYEQTLVQLQSSGTSYLNILSPNQAKRLAEILIKYSLGG